MNPNVRASLGGYDKQRIQKHEQAITFDDLNYAGSGMQGWRFEMEDSHFGCELQYLKGWYLFGVFDGHGGSLSSELASKLLDKHIVQQLFNQVDIKMHGKTRGTQLGSSTIDYLYFDRITDEQIVSAIKVAFIELDKEILDNELIKNEQDKSGTTAVACLITPRSIFLINCGDSRGIFVRGDRIELNTFDHKPTQLKERQRIQNAGGMVALQRVNGGLATSRGLGDKEYKNVPGLKPEQQYVSCEPDIFYVPRDKERDRYIVLACDGIWDVKSNEDVKKYFDEKFKTNTALKIAVNDLLDECLEKGSRDNMTLIAIDLKHRKTRL